MQKSPAATVETIVGALSRLMNVPDIQVNTVGIRPGEKLHETLLTAEERTLAIEHERYFQVRKRGLVIESGSENSIVGLDEYTSENTRILSVDELASLLLEIPMVLESLKR